VQHHKRSLRRSSRLRRVSMILMMIFRFDSNLILIKDSFY
jgi:hypothetical protein